MKAYLVQHGKPLSKEENPERPLSSEGKAEVEKMGKFLKKLGIEVEELYHSGKTRAREPAEILISEVNPKVKPQQRESLAPLGDVNDIAGFLNSTTRDTMVVGHLPHLAKLVSVLVTGNESTPFIRFKQGGVVCVEKEDGNWAVAWAVVPEIL